MSEKSHVGMYQCYFCGLDIGILLDKRLRKSLPMRAGVVNMDPCDECRKWMDKGIILMSIHNNTTSEEMRGKPIMKYNREIGRTPPNPYRTGGWVVLTEDAARRVFTGEFLDFGLKNRFLFITDEAWDKLGLPRGEDNETSSD